MKITSAFCFSAVLLGAALYASAADATASRTWVSGAGLDANPCTRTSPCATFNHAYSVTTAGGEIDVLDGGDYGALTIDHAITIASDAGAVVAAGGSTIQVIAGLGDAVVLRGLGLNGIGQLASGVLPYSFGSLLIDHCNIEGFGISGIGFQPSHAGLLWIKDTVLTNDGIANLGSLGIATQSGNSPPPQATVRLERVHILGAIGNAIRAGNSRSSAPMNIELHDVTIDGSTGGSGIVVLSALGSGPVTLIADNVASSHNAGYGMRAVGAATIYLTRSTITANSVGLGASGGGQIFSYGDNRFGSNTQGNGVAPTPIQLQ